MTRSRRVLGCDPGGTGCLFLVDFETRQGCPIDMPTTTIAGRTRIDHAALADALHDIGLVDRAVVEQVSSSPQMGVVSAFTFGQSYGSLVQAIASAGISVDFVQPAVWTRALQVQAKEPDASRKRASELMPWLSSHWPLKKHHGRSDAALLAFYGWKTT